MVYDDIMAESVRLWKSDGTPQAAIAYLHEQLTGITDRELRARISGLIAKWLKRVGTAGALSDAYRLQSGAIEVLSDPEHVADALCNMVDICVDTHQVEMGVAFALRMTGLMEESQQETAKWAAPFLHNYGRLLALAGDHPSAVARLSTSRDIFATNGQVDESAVVSVALALSLLELGRNDEAERICSEVKLASSNSRVLVHVNVLQMRLNMARGEYSEAGRLLEKAIALAADSVGKSDFRIMVNLLLMEADLDQAKGDLTTARRLRMLARTWAASGRIDG